MTELSEIQTGKVSVAELIPRVTKAVAGKMTGKFLVGLFYARNDYFYCFSVPGNENEENWTATPNEAIQRWRVTNGDSQTVVNPYLV